MPRPPGGPVLGLAARPVGRTDEQAGDVVGVGLPQIARAVRIEVHGPFDGALALVGPDGVVAETTDRELTTTVRGDEPGWLAARAIGGPHPMAPEMAVFAHTTPVYVEVGGARIARAEDARWCLEFLDRLEAHLDEHGRFAEDPDERRRQRADHAEVLGRAREFYRGLCRADQRVVR